jgi:fermentation-respiration switch protein FrsA (DUF1100 family)
MRRVSWLVRSPAGRVVSRLVLDVRVDATGVDAAAWQALPLTAAQLVGAIAPIPLLLVHGDRDRYFPLEHAYALRAAARPPVELWVERGFGHAEVAVGRELVERIGRRVRELVVPGRG